MLVCDGMDRAFVRRFRIKVIGCLAVLLLLLLVSGSGTTAVAYDFPGSCFCRASETVDLECGVPVAVVSETIDEIRNPFIELSDPGIIQSASAYGRGLHHLKMRVDPLPELVPNPVPMYMLMLWIEWACRA